MSLSAPPADTASASVRTLSKEPPSHLVCPLTAELFEDPVCTTVGMTYERSEIEKWFRKNDTDPMTNTKVRSIPFEIFFGIFVSVWFSCIRIFGWGEGEGTGK
jgi:hypothetical protein